MEVAAVPKSLDQEKQKSADHSVLGGSISLKSVKDLTKPGIVFLVALCALAGYGLGYSADSQLSLSHALFFLIGITFLSAGSLSLNQVQEWKIDELMPRTRQRPIPSGRLKPRQGFYIGMSFLILGHSLLLKTRPAVAVMGLITVALYNGFYTLSWKRKMVFAAVPGAVPGAMPVLMGYAAASTTIFTSEAVYAFLIMFLWQMPHFWSLAIRYKDDYKAGGFPVMPVKLGVKSTLLHIGIYTFAYVGLAFMAPFFVPSRSAYFFAVIPMALKVAWEFIKYFRKHEKMSWLPFFLWINFSVLVFLVAPVIDKWSFLIDFILR